eukprot:Amastigsp_a845891_8.p3 type:complete len:215 gc:universal Amastigsp_a845891_8:873-229(-)
MATRSRTAAVLTSARAQWPKSKPASRTATAPRRSPLLATALSSAPSGRTRTSCGRWHASRPPLLTGSSTLPIWSRTRTFRSSALCSRPSQSRCASSSTATATAQSGLSRPPAAESRTSAPRPPRSTPSTRPRTSSCSAATGSCLRKASPRARPFSSRTTPQQSSPSPTRCSTCCGTAFCPRACATRPPPRARLARSASLPPARPSSTNSSPQRR